VYKLTDGQTDIVRAIHTCRAVKTASASNLEMSTR